MAKCQTNGLPMASNPLQKDYRKRVPRKSHATKLKKGNYRFPKGVSHHLTFFLQGDTARAYIGKSAFRQHVPMYRSPDQNNKS